MGAGIAGHQPIELGAAFEMISHIHAWARGKGRKAENKLSNSNYQTRHTRSK
jgi:hypothetical protein